MNNLAPVRNYPGVQGRLYWMPGYEMFGKFAKYCGWGKSI